MSTILPGARADLIRGAGPTSPEFYRFFASLQALAGGSADISALQAAIVDLQQQISAINTGPTYPTLQVDPPITMAGLLQNGFAKLGWDGTTDDVPEGTANLYFTDARASNASMTPTLVASGETFTVPESKQCVFVVPITVDGDLVLDGDLAEAA